MRIKIHISFISESGNDDEVMAKAMSDNPDKAIDRIKDYALQHIESLPFRSYVEAFGKKDTSVKFEMK